MNCELDPLSDADVNVAAARKINNNYPQARLVSRLGEGRGESPPPAFMGIVEALNKVRFHFPSMKC